MSSFHEIERRLDALYSYLFHIEECMKDCADLSKLEKYGAEKCTIQTEIGKYETLLSC